MKPTFSIAQADVVTSEPAKNLEKGEALMINIDLVEEIRSKMMVQHDQRRDLFQLD